MRKLFQFILGVFCLLILDKPVLAGLITDTDLFICDGSSCNIKYGLGLNSTGGLLTNPVFSGTSTGNLSANGLTLINPTFSNTTLGMGTSPINDIITRGPIVDVRAFGAVGNNLFDNQQAFTDAISSITTGVIFIPTGTYNYSVSPNFCKTGVTILAENGAILNHTGTGNAFICDGGASSFITNANLLDITVKGNSNSTNGFYIRSNQHSIFENLRVLGASVTGSAFRLEWCVVDLLINPRASVNEAGGLSPIPLNGILITRRNSGSDHSSTITIINPIMEGFQTANATGIYIDYGYNTTIVGGTSEDNINGVQISGNGFGLNHLKGLDLESNTTDLTITNGVYNTLEGIYSAGVTNINGGYNVINSGVFTTLNIGNFSYNKINNILVSSAVIDNSSTTMWENNIGPGGIPISNTIVSQLKSSINTGTAPLSVSSTTPAINLNAFAVTYSINGTQITNSHIVTGTCTLGASCSVTLTGSAVFTGSTSYVCTAVDTTSAAAVKIVQSSGSAIALTGTGTDVLQFSCIGN